MPLLHSFAQLPLFLARDEASDIMRLLFIAVAVAIWIIGTILSSTKKKKPHPGQREKSWEEILQDLAHGRSQSPQQTPPAPPRPTPPPAQHQSIPLPQRKKMRPKVAHQPKPQPPKRKAQPTPPPLPSAPIAVIETPISQLPAAASDIATTEIGHAGETERRRSPNARAAAIRQCLSPKNLQTQMIVTEILQPPLALRDEPR